MNEQLIMALKAFQKEKERLSKLGIISTYDNFFHCPANFSVQLKEQVFIDSFPKYTVHPWGNENHPYALIAKQDGIEFFTLVSCLEERDENWEEDTGSETTS